MECDGSTVNAGVQCPQVGRRSRIVADRNGALVASGIDDSALNSLTARGRDVLLLMAQGYRVSEIGPRLGVSTSTVETHLKSSRRKLGVSSSLLAARAVYGGDAPPRNLGTALSGVVHDDPATEECNRRPKRTPYRRLKRPPSSGSVTVTDTPFALVAA